MHNQIKTITTTWQHRGGNDNDKSANASALTQVNMHLCMHALNFNTHTAKQTGNCICGSYTHTHTPTSAGLFCVVNSLRLFALSLPAATATRADYPAQRAHRGVDAGIGVSVVVALQPNLQRIELHL